ncbi:DUF4956 domain-containing protein [Candidatus Pelagibacter bacterium]|nr:DUF4956 domain-containing protein [Candidatus Pelagibacter bacterium]
MDFKTGIITIVILISTSIYLRVLLQLIGQRWITTLAHTGTLVLLPIITYIITSVISGNIALSLGMVGALSIVRFRNPVRSPLELSVYFGAITMGISASVDYKWLIFFVITVTVASIVLLLIQFISLNLLKKPFFTASFSEGNSLSSLEIISSGEIEALNHSKFLNLKKVSENQIEYVMISNNFEELQELQKKISDDKKIVNYQLSK